MKWRTEVNVDKNPGYLKYEHASLSVGSCFSDEIGGKLKAAGFDISVNPFGTIFNPVSILQLIQNALDGEIRKPLFLERDMKHFHYSYHSKVYGTTAEDLAKNIEAIQFNVQRKLLQGNHLFLTFGSAWAWRLKSQNVIVANCHKMPAPYFEKELIDLRRLEEFSVQLFSRLFEENPSLKVMVTVSPVRHLREGLRENNVSKGLLHLFTNQLVESFEQISYFPAYEMLVDDLRDYRFYKEDLTHPTEQAVDYVFQKFKDSHFDDATAQKYGLHEQLRKAEQHHFLNATIEEVQKHEVYIQDLKQKLAALSQ